MSNPFRGMSQPQTTHLRPDIVLIEYSDPGAEEAHLSTNTYALPGCGADDSRGHKRLISTPFCAAAV